MPRKTDALGSYEALARDLEREVRRSLVTAMEEEDVIARAEGRNTSDLARKYDMSSTGDGGPRG